MNPVLSHPGAMQQQPVAPRIDDGLASNSSNKATSAMATASMIIMPSPSSSSFYRLSPSSTTTTTTSTSETNPLLMFTTASYPSPSSGDVGPAGQQGTSSLSLQVSTGEAKMNLKTSKNKKKKQLNNVSKPKVTKKKKKTTMMKKKIKTNKKDKTKTKVTHVGSKMPHKQQQQQQQHHRHSNQTHQQQSHSHTSSTSQPRTIPFLRRLVDMLRENKDAICFETATTTPGNSNSSSRNNNELGKIVVKDRIKVENDILPKYFNHRSFASLRRQLNYFNFVRQGKGRQKGAIYTNEDVIVLEDILLLRRRTASGSDQDTEGNNTLPSDIDTSSTQNNVAVTTPPSKRPVSDSDSSSKMNFSCSMSSASSSSSSHASSSGKVSKTPTKKKNKLLPSSSNGKTKIIKKKTKTKTNSNKKLKVVKSSPVVSPSGWSTPHERNGMNNDPYVALDLTSQQPMDVTPRMVSSSDLTTYLSSETSSKEEVQEVLDGCQVLLSLSHGGWMKETTTAL